MKRTWQALKSLTIASIKMYFRNTSAVFFTLFMPILFIVIFGFLFKNTTTTFKLDVTNYSQSELSTEFVGALKQVSSFKIKEVAESQGAADLNKGDADVAVILPAGFGGITRGRLNPSPVVVHYNGARPQNGQTANLIIGQLAAQMNGQISRAPQPITVQASGVKTKDLDYIDFLLPGIIALSVMQMGIFSVAFAFVSYKTTGMLRRLQATPTHPGNFLAAQGLTRLVVGVVQTLILAVLGVVIFHFHLAPEAWLPFVLLAVLGSVVFMGFGFSIAGWARNEDQAAPVAQLIQFPMMFLSGTFFPRDGFPQLLKTITDYLPLTYLADAMRQVANEGAGFAAIRHDLIGLAIWGIVAFVVAVRLFRWE
jgi:ABC-2 type transport system permease protein